MLLTTGGICIGMAAAVAILGILIQMDIPRFLHNSFFNLAVKHTYQKKIDLFIAVMSARENFYQRQAIRETWLKSLQMAEEGNITINVRFVVGKPCEIHPENILEQHGCQAIEWTHLEKTSNLPLVSTVENTDLKSWQQDILVSNVTLTIKHPVIVSSLGVNLAFQLSVDPIKVVLYDDFRDTEIEGVQFSMQDPGVIVDGYRYQSIEQVLLPEGFQGSLRLVNRNKLIWNKFFHESNNQWKINNYGGAVHLKSIDHDKVVTSLERCILLPTLHASVFDIKKLLSHAENKYTLNKQQIEYEENVTNLLREETKNFSDILAVDIVDVYRNLPLKLLACHKWLNSAADFTSKFILKTDDDCFLNIDRIASVLSKFENVEKLWWSNFRDDWVVERYGKWAEHELVGSSYPRFACGSGNIVSSDISEWLALNYAYLKPYQGEDVSMGIWLSAIGPNYIVDNAWQCDRSCTNDSLVIPELKTSEMRKIWTSKLDCDNPCGCDLD